MARVKKSAGNGEVFNATEMDDDGESAAAAGGGFSIEGVAPPAAGIEEAPPPAFAPAPRPVTMSARARQEQRVEDEKDRNADELSAAIAQWAIPGKKYSFDLMRLRPASYKDEATGRTFAPGRDDGKGMFLQHYDEAPTLAEIEDVHGGTDYVLVAKGPDKDNPDKLATKRFKVAILGPPKTLGMPTGAIPFAHVPAPAAPADNTVASVTQNMMTMMQAMLENSRKDTQAMLATIQQAQSKPAAPTIDPATMLRLEEERAEKQRQHELSMKRMELETLARQRADEAAREEARIAREEARAERQRQHDKELAAMKAAEEARREEARERRAESDRLSQMFQQSQKDQASSMEKMLARLEQGKKQEDPEERILRTIELVDRLRGTNDKQETPKEEGPITKAIANALPEVLKTADKFLNNRIQPAPAAAPARPTQPTIIAVDEPPALAAPAAPATAPAVEVQKEQLPPFEWPAEDADLTQQAGLLGKNIELALQAQWGHKRIFDEVLLKFPASFLGMLRALPMEAIISSIEQNAPADAAIRTNSGKLTMRLLYKALVKRGEG